MGEKICEKIGRAHVLNPITIPYPLSSLFFFKGPPTPRNFPPSPPRRSSDLFVKPSALLKVLFCPQYINGRKNMRKDRKSTRLKSNHNSISFILFVFF